MILAAGVFYWTIPAGAQENYYNPGKLAVDNPARGETPDAQGGFVGTEAPVAGQEVDAAKTFTVTSIQKCYAQLGREDALEIQKNYVKPYQECQRRLALKLKKTPGMKAGEVDGQAPEKPGNFYRVQKGGRPAGDADRQKPQKPPVFEEKLPLK